MKVEQIANVSSADITIDNWITLANRINRIFVNAVRTAVSPEARGKGVLIVMNARRHTMNSEFDITNSKALPNVEIVYSYVQPGTAVIQEVAFSPAKNMTVWE